MTLIDFGDFKLRFDHKEVRISIDGEIIDVGARREEEFPKDVLAGTLPTKDEWERMVKKKDELEEALIRGKQSNQK